MTEDSVRIFVAIELPEDITRGLGHTISQLRERIASPDIKWVSVNSIHVTLKFLGEVPATRVTEIVPNLEGVCAATAPMRLHVATLGAFPSILQPRVVWAGLAGDIESLSRLASHVDSVLAELGFPPEVRPFAPHLTLARVRQEATAPVRAALGDAITSASIPQRLSFEAITMSVMRSQLTPRGAIYSRLALLPFGCRPDGG